MNPWPYPSWIAHRGAGKLAPENTLAAFRVGAGQGYRAFECDVKLSADGVPFLLHDSTLDRTTPERGIAGTRPWAELSQLDAGSWHSRAYAGEPIPTLDAIAAFCLRNGHALNIEIKPTEGQEVQTGTVVAHAAARLWAGQAVPPLFSSFQAESLAAAQAAEPQVPRALLLESLRDSWFDEALALGCVAVVTDHRLMDATVIARLHTAGLRALVYTVNETAELKRLLGLQGGGVDGIITDAIDTIQPASATEQLSA